MARPLSLVPLAGVAVIAAACGESTAPFVDRPTYDLVYESTASSQLNQSQIFHLDEGAATPTLLFGGTTFGARPQVSTDGEWIVYLAPPGESADFAIWIARAGGTGARQLYASPTHVLTAPALSPDGSRVAFVKHAPDQSSDIWVINADGSGERQLTTAAPDAVVHGYPAWSPDGQRLAFSAGMPGNVHLETMSAAGGTATPVTETTVNDVEPSWSPDGTRIVFARTSTPAQSDLVIVTLATGRERALHVDRNSRSPAWSPNGYDIAFSGRLPGMPSDIYVVDAESGVVRQRTANDVADRYPTWAKRLPSRVATIQAAP